MKGKSSTMTKDPNFNWIPFYEAFARKLLTYQNNRPGLLDRIYIVIKEFKAEELTAIFHDKTSEGEKIAFEDIDPFSVFCMFNRRNVDEAIVSGKITQPLRNRIMLAKLFSHALEIENSIPKDINFSGVPVLNNPKPLFISDVTDRKETDIQSHWNLFEAAYELAYASYTTKEQKDRFIELFNFSIEVRYVAGPKLSIGLFWAFPNYFPSLDKQTRRYIKDILSIEIGEKFHGDLYLDILKEVHQYMSSASNRYFLSINELAWQAWLYNESA